MYRRAASAQPQSTTTAVLARAPSSSPASIEGTKESPIELGDLTPQPTRRLLFPSPRREGEVKRLDNMALPGAKPVMSSIIEMAIVEEEDVDKENSHPAKDEEQRSRVDDDLAHLFECSPGMFRARTPPRPGKPTTPSRRNDGEDGEKGAALLATPTPARRTLKDSSVNNTPVTRASASAFLPTFSPRETRTFQPSTPSRGKGGDAPSQTNEQTMTPFTRQLTRLLNGNGGGLLDGGKDVPPLEGHDESTPFDFADLPTFTTPGRTLDFSIEDFEFPVGVEL